MTTIQRYRIKTPVGYMYTRPGGAGMFNGSPVWADSYCIDHANDVAARMTAAIAKANESLPPERQSAMTFTVERATGLGSCRRCDEERDRQNGHG